MSASCILLRSLQLCGSLALALLSQAQSPFAFRMVFTHPATVSAYAAEHPPHHTFEERAAEP